MDKSNIMKVLSSGKTKINKTISFKLPERIVSSEQIQSVSIGLKWPLFWNYFAMPPFSVQCNLSVVHYESKNLGNLGHSVGRNKVVCVCVRGVVGFFCVWVSFSFSLIWHWSGICGSKGKLTQPCVLGLMCFCGWKLKGGVEKDFWFKSKTPSFLSLWFRQKYFILSYGWDSCVSAILVPWHAFCFKI